MNTHSLKMIFGLAFGLLIAGCGGLRQAPKPLIIYTISYPSFETAAENQVPAIIKVDRFSSAPGYASSRMIYATSPLERNAYPYHRWFAPPAEMVSAALVRDLRVSGAFHAIVLPGNQIQSSHVLTGGIIDFFEKEEGLSRKAVLLVSILLYTEARSGISQKIVLQKQYRTEADCRSRNVTAFAEAMNRAVQTFSKELIHDLYEAVSAQEPVEPSLSHHTGRPAGTNGHLPD